MTYNGMTPNAINKKLELVKADNHFTILYKKGRTTAFYIKRESKDCEYKYTAGYGTPKGRGLIWRYNSLEDALNCATDYLENWISIFSEQDLKVTVSFK